MDRHQITRVRRETRRRRLTVSSVETLTPHMLRLVFTSPELKDFDSAAHDDHVKLFFPQTGDAEAKPAMRDFTPRRFDTSRGTLTIDFAIHDEGPATSWATQAKIGDTLEIGGPRGSSIVPDDFDWYLLIGDETALPAIGRRVEELRAGVPVTTLAVIPDMRDVQTFQTRAAWSPRWLARDGRTDDAALILAALESFERPPGDGFVWIAAEGAVARAVRSHLVVERAYSREWIKAAGYWARGKTDAHERIED